MNPIPNHQTCVTELPCSESPRTTSDVAREVGKSTTRVKQLVREIHVPIMKTASGIWIWNAIAVEKLKQEIARREVENTRL